jgi:ATP/ADP translocase
MIERMTAAGDTSNPTVTSQLFGFQRREFIPVAWSFAYFFCVLSSYYILRPVREAARTRYLICS